MNNSQKKKIREYCQTHPLYIQYFDRSYDIQDYVKDNLKPNDKSINDILDRFFEGSIDYDSQCVWEYMTYMLDELNMGHIPDNDFPEIQAMVYKYCKFESDFTVDNLSTVQIPVLIRLTSDYDMGNTADGYSTPETYWTDIMAAYPLNPADTESAQWEVDNHSSDYYQLGFVFKMPLTDYFSALTGGSITISKGAFIGAINTFCGSASPWAKQTTQDYQLDQKDKYTGFTIDYDFSLKNNSVFGYGLQAIFGGFDYV